MNRLILSALLLAVCHSSPAQSPVPIGKGSYASSPPPQADQKRNGDKAANMDSWPIAVDPSALDQPIPTNQWWTNLITRPFTGTVWPYPLAVRPETSGVRVFFPVAWNAGGNDMLLERPIAIRADSGGGLSRPDVVIADFEGNTFPEGWSISGDAFGEGPASGPVDGQSPVEGYIGKSFANSHHGGDRMMGELSSPAFVIERKRLQFLVGGGKNPETLGVRLLVNGVPVRQANGIDRARPVVASWDVEEFAGKEARIVIVDESTGGWGHVMADQFVQTDREAPAAGAAADETTTFHAKACQALRWGDWSLTLRMPGDQSEKEFLDVTIGRGMPYCWVDFHEVAAVVETFDGAAFETADGKPAVFPMKSDRVVIAFPDRKFVVFAPPGSEIEKEGPRLRIQFSGPLRRIAVSPLPAGVLPEALAAAAMTPPLDTRISWTYDPKAATVQTRWDMTLDGEGKQMVQGWLPHHYRDGQAGVTYEGPEFSTPRGKMRCALGTSFSFTFRFDGMLPTLPAPTGEGGFNTARMEGYLSAFADKWKYGGDTYWGGKDLLRAGQCLDIAAETGRTALAEDLKGKLHNALADWFTYTPGEPEHYFARYSRWKALIGFNDSYGSFQFTDNHFHYGYFTMASALLALHDPGFLPEFGPMATLVAKQYANWDRNDREFPFLRTFDIWEGHSNAGGFGGPNGNNQESSSEAMQSWGGLFLLGSALGDSGMRDAGAMGFAMERAATMQYWFNYPAWKEGPAASNWPPAYKHSVGGIVFSAGQAFATYFSGDPGWIYGIQWLPVSPVLDYLAIDPAFSKWLYGRMWEERAEWLTGHNQRREKEAAGRNQAFFPEENTISSIGSALGNVLLGYQLQFDPASMLAEFDKLWAAGDAVGTDPNGAPVNYYLAHANLALGPRQWDWHASLPTAAVFKLPTSGALTFVAVNYSDKPVEVAFSEKGTASGILKIPPHQIVSSGNLQAIVPPAAP
ncbi:MAG: glycosyl hydrolase [Terrimicrobiaceae bacterium]